MNMLYIKDTLQNNLILSMFLISKPWKGSAVANGKQMWEKRSNGTSQGKRCESLFPLQLTFFSIFFIFFHLSPFFSHLCSLFPSCNSSLDYLFSLIPIPLLFFFSHFPPSLFCWYRKYFKYQKISGEIWENAHETALVLKVLIICYKFLMIFWGNKILCT